MIVSLRHIVESLIFTSEQPLKQEDIYEVISRSAELDETLENVSQADVEIELLELLEKYKSEEYPFEIKKLAGGYQFFTKANFHPYIKQANLVKNQRKLSKAALETLAIIAYKQPVSRPEIEHIRGVNCDYAVQKLLERKLICISGRADAPGKPLLYSTDSFFLQYLGLNHISDLPKPKEFEETAEDQVGNFSQESSQPTTENSV